MKLKDDFADQKNIERVRAMIVGFDGSKQEYLTTVEQNLALFREHWFRLHENIFLIDADEGHAGYLNVVQLCNKYNIPLIIFDLADSEIEISPGSVVEAWLARRNYRLKKLRA
jgi:hypothetical protein